MLSPKFSLNRKRTSTFVGDECRLQLNSNLKFAIRHEAINCQRTKVFVELQQYVGKPKQIIHCVNSNSNMPFQLQSVQESSTAIANDPIMEPPALKSWNTKIQSSYFNNLRKTCELFVFHGDNDF